MTGTPKVKGDPPNEVCRYVSYYQTIYSCRQSLPYTYFYAHLSRAITVLHTANIKAQAMQRSKRYVPRGKAGFSRLRQILAKKGSVAENFGPLEVRDPQFENRSYMSSIVPRANFGATSNYYQYLKMLRVHFTTHPCNTG